ncbi:ABC transporter [Brachybacterium endophyticum]|uniref:Transport permease protein n=1 Tax=Brachybacterium endophyticum TaxID=2182385 RepID=A0A2U2RKP0_9MICO|nr:ABC transporter permease [Brachybacterium endophyticum]PWH06449.1 ABC transporter [Brachybacterium endophyticum]
MRADADTVPQILRSLEAEGMDASHLGPIGVRPRMTRYLSELWERRHFVWMDSRHRVATQNSSNLLGNLWLVLRPLLDAAMYFLIFGVILDAHRGIDNFAAYIIIGVMMFRSTSRSISQGPGILRSNKAMIRAFSFPRAALPISAEIRDAMQMVITVAVMLAMIIVLPKHELPQVTWLLIVPIFALQSLLNLGISFLFARIGYVLPDVSQAMTVISRFLMYGSGVIFPIERFFDHPVFAAIIHANPIYQLVHMYRVALMDGAVPELRSWVVLGAWAVGLLIVGFLFFWRGEATYGDEKR